MLPYAEMFLVNTVTLKTQVYPVTDSGDTGEPVPSSGTTLKASVQPAKGNRTVGQGSEQSTVEFVAYFAANPIDTADDAREGGLPVSRDLLIWRVDPEDPEQDRTLLILAPARDEGGQGMAWSLDLRETA